MAEDPGGEQARRSGGAVRGPLCSQIGQRTYDSIVTLADILFGHPYHQRLELAFHLGATGVTALFGAIEFARDKPTVPAKDCVRLGDVRHVRKRLAPEPMTDFSERRALNIR